MSAKDSNSEGSDVTGAANPGSSITLDELLERNREWSERVNAEDPGFFDRLSQQQAPEYLWIGCSDSRVPANQIIDMAPGEVFVHRNIANVVVHTDLNCLSVIQFAVDVLKVKHIIVVGHYGCGGVHAALHGLRVGLADNWIRHVGDVADKHADCIAHVHESERHDRLCELNAIEQVQNVCMTTIVRDAWSRGQPLSVHGWVYSLRNGRVHNTGMDVDSFESLQSAYTRAIATVHSTHGGSPR
ncbi:carbonate dehydratase [Lysobacter capsici]|jgi:carbonic anhydrase|uniref:Carbonic anhydrase n=1 Tax=Lysobacter capsici AZ78 TaxID=1444315 RepID=A0A125U0J8_9GAMM|nr:carbonate dehydratase [Lysobacter capsici]KWS02813.1 Carbonic anhydrase [Lysobacter capsici AZ78]UOF12651.1 carbonate dehydratase [Lysobacter capsici]